MFIYVLKHTACSELSEIVWVYVISENPCFPMHAQAPVGQSSALAESEKYIDLVVSQCLYMF